MKVWLVFLLAIVIFLAGAITGGLAVRARMHPVALERFPAIPLRPQMRMEFLHRMDRELNLTTNQYGRIEGIIRLSHERMQKLLEPITPQAQDEARTVKRQIAAELTPEQARRFDELMKARRGDPTKRRRREERQTNGYPAPSHVDHAR